jgi:hypothetical protein
MKADVIVQQREDGMWLAHKGLCILAHNWRTNKIRWSPESRIMETDIVAWHTLADLQDRLREAGESV